MTTIRTATQAEQQRTGPQDVPPLTTTKQCDRSIMQHRSKAKAARFRFADRAPIESESRQRSQRLAAMLALRYSTMQYGDSIESRSINESELKVLDVKLGSMDRFRISLLAQKR